MIHTPYRTLELLELGRDRVETFWRPSLSSPEEDCALTAIANAQWPSSKPRTPGGLATALASTRALRNSLPGILKFIPVWGRSVARYNDEPGRNKDDILALYDRAIARKRRHVAMVNRVRSLWAMREKQDAHHFRLP